MGGESMGESELTDLSVKVPKELDQSLRELVRLEQCRSYRQLVLFFFEVFAGIVERKPSLRLKARQQTDVRMKGQVRVDVPKTLRQTLERIAAGYGMEMPELTRVSLEGVLSYHRKFAPSGEIVSKEELITRIVEDLEATGKPFGAD